MILINVLQQQVRPWAHWNFSLTRKKSVHIPSTWSSWQYQSTCYFGGVRTGLWELIMWTNSNDLSLDKFESFCISTCYRSKTNVRITLDELRSRFNNITSVQTMIDIRKIQFLGKIVRDHVSTPPRQLLISYVSNKRRVGRPQKCSREAMFDSLKRVLHDVQEIHLDRTAALSHWYFDALDATFWKKLLDHHRDPTKPVPERPNRNANFNNRRNPRRNRTGSRQESSQRSNVSPPRRRSQPRENTTSPRGRGTFDPNNVGHYIYDSLRILELGYDAEWVHVKAAYRRLATMYHPDQFRNHTTVTGITSLEEAAEYMKLLNNARDYLKNELKG